MLRITLAGAPNAKELDGMSFVTIEPAPITQLSPTLTPDKTITLQPNQQLFPICIGKLYCKPLLRTFADKGWLAVTKIQLGPNFTQSPTKISASSTKVK